MSMAEVDPTDMELLAWVGPDEFDGSRGIKAAQTPAGFVPLVAKDEHAAKIRSDSMRKQLQDFADLYGNRIQLVRFRFIEVVETLEPR